MWSGGSIRRHDLGVGTDMRVMVGAGIALLAVLALVVGASALLDDDSNAPSVGIRLEGVDASVQGVGFFDQNGERTTGFVAVWGLEPNTEHAVHFHGPNSECGSKADPVAVHPDLRADEDGVAFTSVDVTAGQPLLEGGFYYNVHEGPSSQAENPEIACGDLEPADASAATR
jgi:hypothetical protein